MLGSRGQWHCILLPHSSRLLLFAKQLLTTWNSATEQLCGQYINKQPGHGPQGAYILFGKIKLSQPNAVTSNREQHADLPQIQSQVQRHR